MSAGMSLEGLIGATPKERMAFEKDCAETFASEAGTRVLAMLCAVAHPLRHGPGMTEHEHGRAEVVALLWRYAARENGSLAREGRGFDG